MRLIICEKNNAAKRISAILSNGKNRVEKRARTNLYVFNWEGEETYTIGLRGHLLNVDFPSKYNRWTAVEPRMLIDVEPVSVTSERSISRVLKSIAAEADTIYVATDYDREGELIGTEAVEWALGPEAIDQAWRARFSSLTPDEVKESFCNLVRIDRNLASAAQTRQILDLVWGATLTRFISLASGRLGHGFLSVGRVQSPTLAIVVNREKEIKAFKPTPYWIIEAGFLKEGLRFTGKHARGEFTDGDEAGSIYQKIRNERTARVRDVIRKERVDKPPIPFNTTGLIRAANTIGLSAARTMKIAEELYMDGYISYPRTDNTGYPKGIDLRKCVEELAKGPYMETARYILNKTKIVPTRGNKITTDHPPIYTTAFVNPLDLHGEKRKVYDLVTRRFLATLHDPCKVMITTIKLDIIDEPFSASGVRMVTPGWRAVYTFSKIKEETMPDLKGEEEVDVEGVELLAKETKPPRRFSQGGLIQEMERLGLGTKSTRHEIIQKLYDRRYVEDSPPKPTLSGEAVIISLERHATPITEHDMTSRLEEDMGRISCGKLSQEEVIDESRDMLRGIMEVLEEHKKAIGEDISSALKEQDVVGICPRCNNPMLLTRSRWGKRYVRCSQAPGCSKTYPLPQRGRMDTTSDSCPTCRSPIIRIYRKGRPPLRTCVNPECPSRRRGGERDEGS